MTVVNFDKYFETPLEQSVLSSVHIFLTSFMMTMYAHQSSSEEAEGGHPHNLSNSSIYDIII